MKTELIATYEEAPLQKLIAAASTASFTDSVGEFSHLRTLIPVAPSVKEFLDHHYLFQRRYKLEEDTNFRHPISYGVFYTYLPTGEVGYLLYVRTKKAGESRLHGKKSIGIGGHVDLTEVGHLIDSGNTVPTLQDIISACQVRELNEEFAFAYEGLIHSEALVQHNISDIELLINSNNGVDQFHLGAVGFTKLSPSYADRTFPVGADSTTAILNVVSKEEDNIFLKFATLSELVELRAAGELESWSEIIVDRLEFISTNALSAIENATTEA